MFKVNLFDISFRLNINEMNPFNKNLLFELNSHKPNLYNLKYIERIQTLKIYLGFS